jgi:phosphomannomutase
MGKLFGTDGIRGVVGEDLTSKLAMNIGELLINALGGGLLHYFLYVNY